MSKANPIIELHPWLALPSGQAALEYEQIEIDRIVCDVFGFHALQLGLPEIDGLRTNRMRYRWLALDAFYKEWMSTFQSVNTDKLSDCQADKRCDLQCDFDYLPFANNSLDLMVLPHALELCNNPHHTLQEAARVLVPEGRLVITVFNPYSLWGLRQRFGRWGIKPALVLPQCEFVSARRLKDWLHLLGFEVETINFSIYRPLLKDPVWWARFEWIEKLGRKWWPQCGSIYYVVAIKRVRHLRLVGRVKQAKHQHQTAQAGVSQKHIQ